MTPVEQFAAWRAELSLELDETSEKLKAERARLAVAEVAYREAREANAALQKFAKDAFATLLVNNGIAGPLHARLLDARDEILKGPEGERGGARAATLALEDRNTQLRDAINQIDVALTGARVTQLRPAAAPSRREPAPVEFDNIMPGRAV